MPMYDYRCNECSHEFSEFHRMNVTDIECPECESEHVVKRITDAPTIAGGMMTHAGDGKNATKEELQSKWKEETPKLRKKLVDKLGEDAVKGIPSLNDDN